MTTATENLQQSIADAAATAATDAGSDQDFGSKAERVKALFEELCRMVPEGVCSKEDCSQMLMDGRDKAMRAGKKALTTIRSHPVETALIAVGVGLATWWLMTRK